jgi:hypothetical protein
MKHLRIIRGGLITLACAIIVVGCGAPAARGAERLPNGIELPADWPPRRTTPWDHRTPPVPYLLARPSVVPIDVGRQLFVDDFLIESTTLRRRHHRPTYHAASPVLRPDQPWERTDRDGAELADQAAPYSDGVWYDPRARRYLMWYLAADRATCLATSADGLRWTKPALDVEPGTNIVLRTVRDASTVWLDHQAADDERFKLFEARYRRGAWQLALRTSGDGVHWSEEVAASGPSWDRSTVFYNPFRQRWVGSIRGHDQQPPAPPHRLRVYRDGRTVAELLDWKQHCDEAARADPERQGDLIFWTGADRRDPRHPDPRFRDEAPQLYNLDVFPYESLLVGLFTLWQGPANEICQQLGIHKRNEVLVGYSRDGFHWHRPDRRPFLPVSDDPRAWNHANVQSVGGGCLVDERELRFYCSGRTMHPRSTSATGLATLRRDGFVSLDATAAGQELVTRPVAFTGRYLFVNAAPGAGTLRAEVLDTDGQVLPGYAAAQCRPVTGDHTQARLVWSDDRGEERDLESLRDRPVRFRFHLTGGSFYAFWVTSDPAGASHGYVAAGGPPYPGPRDLPRADR